MHIKRIILLIITSAVLILMSTAMNTKKMNKTEIATFGGGCFWCTEAIFDQLEGVISVESGYAGGTSKNITYKEVCSGTTGHAEVIHITYNPSIIAFTELLEVFFATHNPTTLNRQGADVGTQYRSSIFYHNAEQKEIAQAYINELEQKEVFQDPIVTTLERFDVYVKAENYHQNYFENNGSTNQYCTVVINPKLEKFKKQFKHKLKK